MNHTLTETPQLSYPESLYVADRSLEGYEELYHKAGPFRVNSDMIGFTPRGEAKVWMNENYGVNHPSHEQGILQSTTKRKFTDRDDIPIATGEETTMVRNIIDVV